MSLRAARISLFLACLVCSPAIAGQPSGLVGQIITNAEATASIPPPCFGSFEWYEYFGSPVQLDLTDTLTLDLAIIPFRSGVTALGLDEGQNATTFVGIDFSDGLVRGLPYDRYRWNDVTVQVRPASQDFLLTVNGVGAGPFPYGSPCPGGCFSVQAFRLNGSGNGGGAIAWIDSVSVVRESAGGRAFLAGSDFDSCRPQPSVTGGGLVISEPPQPIRSRR